MEIINQSAHHLIIRKEKILFFFVLFIPLFADQLTGYLREELDSMFPLSLITKGAIALYFIYGSFLYSPEKIRRSIFILILIVTIHFIFLSISNKVVSVRDIQLSIECILFPISYLFWRGYFEKKHISEKHFRTTIFLLFMIIVVAIILSTFGFGLSSYHKTREGLNVGHSGYFIATNELSALVLIFLGIIMFNYHKHRLKPSLITISLGFLITVLIGTKTMLVGFISMLILIPLLALFYYGKRFIQTIIKHSITILPGLAIISATVLILFWEKIIPIIDRWKYKFEHHDSLLSFVSSSRNLRIGPIFENYFLQARIPDYFLGVGYDRFYDLNYSTTGFGTIEIDLLDIFLINGPIFTIIIYFIWFSIFRKLVNSYKYRLHNQVIGALALYLLLFINSFISGHILTSSMIAIYLGFTTAYALTYQEKYI